MMWKYVPCVLFSAVTPLAILEYKYNKSHRELLANVREEDCLTYEYTCIFPDPLFQKQLQEVRKSSDKIKHWQSAGPRIQLFTSVPKRYIQKKD